ncbi:ATP-dependent Clp protease adaptor ClpS [Urbifossiella limnaea]|uniref:ATP-dependent Clp protease adaptor n=1 Tax=Urbifossiella limnaea TaxID=2528023 RepID=A0A517XY27_9BACT|nr:ATP-dependent Clp protease adaptor ClpS [Urbifossiella limnaea]QDU22420.1 ATP-dependent Clp protease adaptor [Urbifossiella limnaea]
MSSGPAVLPELDEQTETRTRHQPPYHVILLDDDDHTFEYVAIMLLDLFAHPLETGFKLAEEVHKTGRAIVCTTSLERAELKQEQIHAYGPDPRSQHSSGSMTAVLEPAE